MLLDDLLTDMVKDLEKIEQKSNNKGSEFEKCKDDIMQAILDYTAEEHLIDAKIKKNKKLFKPTKVVVEK